MRLSTVLIAVFFIAAGCSEAVAQLPTLTIQTAAPVQNGGTWNFTAGGTYTTGTLTFVKVTIELQSVTIAGGVVATTPESPTTAAAGNYTGILVNGTYTPKTKDYSMRANLYVRNGDGLVVHCS